MKKEIITEMKWFAKKKQKVDLLENRITAMTKYIKHIESLAKKIENAEKTDKHIITLAPSEELIAMLTRMVENDPQLSIDLLMADGTKMSIKKKQNYNTRAVDPFSGD